MEYGKFLSPIGIITFGLSNGQLCKLTIDDLNVFTTDSTDVYAVKHQLDLYFKGELKAFSLPIIFKEGTPFQREVWEALCTIPFGKSISYQDLAHIVNRPKAVRAIGQACKRNPIGIVVPCHRVIGKNGQLTGYSGKDYIHIKQALLTLEKAYV